MCHHLKGHLIGDHVTLLRDYLVSTYYGQDKDNDIDLTGVQGGQSHVGEEVACHITLELDSI